MKHRTRSAETTLAAQRGRPKAFDPNEALERAMLLFWRHGYETTSISDLTETMGITAPSLYGTFGDKKQLFLKAVDFYVDAYGDFIPNALAGEATVERAIHRLLREAVDIYSDGQHPKGCLVIHAATNCTAQSTDVLNALAERRSDVERTIRNRLQIGKVSGQLPREINVSALAGVVVSTMYGLALKARDGASRASLRAIVEQVMQQWPRNKTLVKAR